MTNSGNPDEQSATLRGIPGFHLDQVRAEPSRAGSIQGWHPPLIYRDRVSSPADMCRSDTIDLEQWVTVLTLTNPIPTIPSTAILEQSHRSYFQVPGFERLPKVIVMDGIQKFYRDRIDDYARYHENLQQLIETDEQFLGTKLLRSDRWLGISGAIELGLSAVETPLVFIHQHDFQLNRPVDLHAMAASMRDNELIQHIRLGANRSNEANGHDWYVDQQVQGKHYLPLTRTFGWSDNDHLTRVSYYRDFVLPQCRRSHRVRVAPEHVLHFTLMAAVRRYGMAGHHLFGTYLYGPPTDGGYLRHLEGRRTHVLPDAS